MAEQGAPVYVKVNEYKEILDIIELIKGKITEVRTTLEGIDSLRNDEDAEVTAWADAINEIEKKIEDIDRMMFEPEE
jgi:prefoldin subunit 5